LYRKAQGEVQRPLNYEIWFSHHCRLCLNARRLQSKHRGSQFRRAAGRFTETGSRFKRSSACSTGRRRRQVENSAIRQSVFHAYVGGSALQPSTEQAPKSKLAIAIERFREWPRLVYGLSRVGTDRFQQDSQGAESDGDGSGKG